MNLCDWSGCANHSDGLCVGHALRARRLIDHLVADYVTIRATMPVPTGSGRSAPRESRVSTHPAETASDVARSIADVLDGASESLRDHLGHLPPPPRARAEGRVVAHAWATITARWDTFTAYPGTQSVLADLRHADRDSRRLLGIAGASVALPIRCLECETKSVFRTVGMDRSDRVHCETCGWWIDARHYGLLTRAVLDQLLEDDDTPNAQPA